MELNNNTVRLNKTERRALECTTRALATTALGSVWQNSLEAVQDRLTQLQNSASRRISAMPCTLAYGFFVTPYRPLAPALHDLQQRQHTLQNMEPTVRGIHLNTLSATGESLQDL